MAAERNTAPFNASSPPEPLLPPSPINNNLGATVGSPSDSNLVDPTANDPLPPPPQPSSPTNDPTAKEDDEDSILNLQVYIFLLICAGFVTQFVSVIVNHCLHFDTEPLAQELLYIAGAAVVMAVFLLCCFCAMHRLCPGVSRRAGKALQAAERRRKRSADPELTKPLTSEDSPV